MQKYSGLANDTSFEEKSVWIQLISVALVVAGYFIVTATMLVNGITALGDYVPLFVAAVILLVVFLVAGHIVAAVIQRPEKPDERDQLIDWRSESNASWVIGPGVLTAILCLVFAVEPVWVTHLLILTLFLSELTKLSFQLHYYRQGIGR